MNLDEKIISTKFKTKGEEKYRAELLLKIYPNIDDIDTKFSAGYIPEEVYYFQIYFNDFINWFENNIFTIQSFIDKNLLIKKINQEFINYLKIKHNGFIRAQKTENK